jgi:transposase-like protein
MRFLPSHCPQGLCPSLTSGRFRFRRKGSFLRGVDGRRVPRFLCLECQRTFSLQTFRLDYRLKRPQLSLQLFFPLIGKVTLRQLARTLGCTRKVVAQRIRLLGEHCRDFHARVLAGTARAACSQLQLDELETFEHHRLLKPLTVPVLIEPKSFFVFDTAVAPLPCRGGLTGRLRRAKARLEAQLGPRRSGSREAVRRCFQTARDHLGGAQVTVTTDRKSSYPGILRQVFGETGSLHQQIDAGEPRKYGSGLFAINLTLAMLRDGLSRLVRRSWAASKRALWLQRHLWIWTCWRNYLRARANWRPHWTPAMQLGLLQRPLRKEELLRWRIFPQK